jgi:hypothetical protein
LKIDEEFSIFNFQSSIPIWPGILPMIWWHTLFLFFTVVKRDWRAPECNKQIITITDEMIDEHPRESFQPMLWRRSMKKVVILAMMVVLVVGLTGTASALTVGDHTWEERDDVVFGPGSITHDSATDLEWLDVSITKGRSYNDVFDSINDLNNDLYGFQYATATELHQMFGVFDTNGAVLQDLLGEAEELVRLLGPTTDWEDRVTQGLYDDGGADSELLVGRAWLGVRPPWRCSVVIKDSELKDYVNRGLGHWLVREASPQAPIPEPATLMLLGVGLLGLLALRRKDSQKR